MGSHRFGNWYFGWNIVAAAATLTLLTVGMRMGIGPFFLPIIEDLGFSRSALSTIIAIGMLCYGLAMPAAGALVTKYGTRNVLLLGNSIVILACIWTVNARDTMQFFLAFGILLSIGLGFASPVTVTPVLTRWFIRQRGMALFFLSTGSMAGIAVMTPLLTTFIEHYSWQQTLLGFAIVYTLFTIPIAFFVIRDNAPEHADQTAEQIAALQATTSSSKQIAPHISLGQAFRTSPFWKITLGLFACGYSMNLLGTHGLPMLIDHGFSATTSSLGIGLIGLVAIFGTVVLGRLSDIFSRKKILFLIYLVRGLGFLALLSVTSPWELYLTASISGLVWAGSIAMSSAILADQYGVRLVGVLYGTAYVGHQIGAMISSWLGGWAYEQYATHWIAFGSAAILLFTAALVSLLLPNKNNQLFANASVAS